MAAHPLTLMDLPAAAQVCKSLYPKMKRIAADNPDVLWVKLNGSDPNLAPLFEAMDIKKVCAGMALAISLGDLHAPRQGPAMEVAGRWGQLTAAGAAAWPDQQHVCHCMEQQREGGD